jgi:hypothetical protein
MREQGQLQQGHFLMAKSATMALKLRLARRVQLVALRM